MTHKLTTMNAHIKPGQLVPAELRLEIYKEAKRSIEAGDTVEKYKRETFVLYLLEAIVFENDSQVHDDVLKQMFPEFKKDVSYDKNKHQALDKLTKAIEKLEAELAPIKSKGLQTIIDNIANRINDNLNELSFDAALDCFVQIRENMRDRRAAEIAALEQPKNERLIYLKSIEL